MSGSEGSKIPLKIAENSIQKFNEQIQHKVGLLKNYRSNMTKSLALKDFEKLKKDQINATRVMKQLKQLLIDIDDLKWKIKDEEMDKFRKLTHNAREEALIEIQKHLDFNPIEKVKHITPSLSTESTLEPRNDEDPIGNIQLQVDLAAIRKKQLESKEAYLHEFENLQREVEDIYEIYKDVNEMVVVQGEAVDKIEENVEHAEVNVEQGAQQLQQALKYKQYGYPLLGGLFGMMVCGPVGLVIGLKAGIAGSAVGGVAGFCGGKLLKKSNNIQREAIKEE
jgi:syntaxin 17